MSVVADPARPASPLQSRWSSLVGRGGWPFAVAALVCVAYLPSVPGGWLGYDDDWLVRDNEVLSAGSPSALGTVWIALDRESRLALGAEYLPVRDMWVWTFRGLLQLGPSPLRALLLATYLLALVPWWRWAARLPERERPFVAFAVALFALHPIHAESVAWLAGVKDVLCLLFVGAALDAWSAEGPRWKALPFVALAALSKSVAVTTPLLFLTHDLWLGRRIERGPLALALGIGAGLAALHAWVGSVVGMFAEPLGSSAIERVGSVGVIFARYLGVSLLVEPSSGFRDVEIHGADAAGLGALALLVVLGAGAALAWQRQIRWPAFALALFVLPLMPVSQLFAPLQNRMADRYLLVAVLGPMIAVAGVLQRALGHVRPPLARLTHVVVLVVLAALTALRAHTFADPIAFALEGTSSTSENVAAPLLLGTSLEHAERANEAESAYREAMRRDGLTSDRGRRAGNGLGRVLAAQGRLPEALDAYRTLVARYPDDPRVLHNLAVIERRLGLPEAAEHEAEVARRFPTYRPGADRPGPL